ncbi:hypothetical protein D3C85_992250 [compost metagenome]
MQAQGHIGVFGRVRAGLLKGDLVERQLLGAFAGDVLEADGGMSKVLERQAVHVMAGGRGVKHIGLEHGVEGHAPDLNATGRITTDSAIGQDVDVVLGVLTHLDLGRVLQQRLEGAQHGVAVELLGHAHVGVRERNVSRLEGLDSKG